MKTDTPFEGFLLLPDGNESVRTMTREESEVYIQLYIGEDKFSIPEDDEDWPTALRVMFSRIPPSIGRNVIANDAVWVLLGCLEMNDRPGVMVMWAYTLVALRVKLGHSINIEELTYKFPMGFPTPEAADVVWDTQKTPEGDNMVDSPEYWRKLFDKITHED